MIRRPPGSTRTDTLFPYTTLFRSIGTVASEQMVERGAIAKRGRFAGRRIRALFFPQGSEGAEVERHQRRTRRLRTFDALDRRVKPGNRPALARNQTERSEERRGGKEWVSTGSTRWSPDH